MTLRDERPVGAYDFAAIEAKWQRLWAERGTFRAPNPADAGFDRSRPKLYVLDMFPYPSGAGLHVGHPIGYCATDIYVRYKRMRGFNVLHPMGYDAFGLPAEQYAIETGVHPAITTRKNIETMGRQLKRFGFSYDWDREIATCDVSFYKFTQWIFLQLYNSWYDPAADAARPVQELIAKLESGEVPPRVDRSAAEFSGAPGTGQKIRPAPDSWQHAGPAERRQVIDSRRLAYLADVTVNWCPALGTVLANEEVTNEGLSDRGNHPVYRRPLRQWMLRITRYADRLLGDLEGLDWPEAIKSMQRNWIGRSTGADIDFPIVPVGPGAPTVGDVKNRMASRAGGFPERPESGVIRVYTTRPDTVHGATYMVLAPEHPVVETITTAGQRVEVDRYVERARHRSDMDRTTDTKEKTGVFTGGYAINPANGRRIPVWAADYVLMGYGTGAIMGVPGSDVRDFAFAKAFGLDIITVVEPTLEWCEEIARLPKGTLSEMRAAAADRLAASMERWKRDHAVGRKEHVAFVDGYLSSHRPELGLTVEAIQKLYVLAPQVFAAPFCEAGVAVHSPGDAVEPDGVCDLNRLPTETAKSRIIEWLEAKGLGRGAVNYKLRDWVFSRQKYWGEPFPVLHGPDGEVVALDESELPIELPELSDFRPRSYADDPHATPSPPLTRVADWMKVERGGMRYTRDANTMPQWAGSCWYYLRYLSPGNGTRLCDEDAERYWMPVDLYVGGAEHAVLHLLYARFWHKVLFDLRHVSTAEPFLRLVNQGMVQAVAFRDPSGRILNQDHVRSASAGKFESHDGQSVEQITAKMSKSLKNTVSPDEIIGEYGADAFRLYEMFMGPIEASKPWNSRDVPGLFKLLQRTWRLVVDEETGELSPKLDSGEPDAAAVRRLHKTIKSIGEDVEALKFNTAIAAMFEFVNEMTPRERRPRAVIESFVLLLAPFAPHIAEELWQRLGHGESLANAAWPAFDPALAKDDEVEIAVQVTGKVRARIRVPVDADEKTMESAAMADETIRKEIAGKTVKRVIVVKGRLVNIVTT
ncbi:MAG: leucine--tRNA ligase [Phycisphaerales bacterium]|nr:leucine--tRNA ligase [Phycisphaerales bacterium]